MKKLVEAVEMIIWGLTLICLWSSAIFGPVGILIGLIFFLTKGFNQPENAYLFESSNYIYIFMVMIISVISTSTGFIYVFKYRKIISNRRDLKYILLSMLLFILLMSSYLKNRYNENLMKHIELYQAMIKCFDTESKKPIPITLQPPDTSSVMPFPKTSMLSLRENDSVNMTVNIIHFTKPKIKVSSEGYEEKELTIDKDSYNFDVFLKKIPKMKKNQKIDTSPDVNNLKFP